MFKKKNQTLSAQTPVKDILQSKLYKSDRISLY